ncbi:MAG: hypothetical protein K8U57_24695 [Planctomycetes bacterium]|nr:hypothetical protein [Planctomycetota bacterium]
MKSATGFKLGKTVECTKCGAEFEVEEPAEEEVEEPKKGKAAPSTVAKKPVKAVGEDEAGEDEEERPKKKKKKKKRDEEQEWSYRNSWIRYAILTVLLIVMCVLGYMLYLKREREARSSLEIEAPMGRVM